MERKRENNRHPCFFFFLQLDSPLGNWRKTYIYIDVTLFLGVCVRRTSEGIIYTKRNPIPLGLYDLCELMGPKQEEPSPKI